MDVRMKGSASNILFIDQRLFIEKSSLWKVSDEVKSENLYFSIFLLFWDFLSRTGSPGAPGEPVLSTWGARLS